MATDVTQLLKRIESGDKPALGTLMELVYVELRSMASSHLQGEGRITIRPTELVNEAYLRIVDADGLGQWNCRAHFFGAASEAMRRILVEHARSKASVKRGQNHRLLQLDDSIVQQPAPPSQILAIHEALDELEEHDAIAAQLVKLRYFVGLQHQEAAEVLGVSKRVADRLWSLAKTWMYRSLNSDS